MDIKIIKECIQLSLEENLSFADVLKKLNATGVQRYIVDLVGRQTIYFSTNDETYTALLDFPSLRVASGFNAAAVKNALADIQQKTITYKDFLHRIILAGCSHYEVFISGSKVIYSGRDGSQHIEHFPRVKW